MWEAPLCHSAAPAERRSCEEGIQQAYCPGTYREEFRGSVSVSGIRQSTHSLNAGQAVEVSVGFVEPSKLPVNGRIAVEWKLADSDGALARVGGRKADDFGIYTLPTANWRKTLHALDPDVYLIYRAPTAGKYVLTLTPVVKEAPVGDGARWREKGEAPEMFPVPTSTPWPKGAAAPCA